MVWIHTFGFFVVFFFFISRLIKLKQKHDFLTKNNLHWESYMSDFLICSSVIKQKSFLCFAHFMFNINTLFSVFMQCFPSIWYSNLECLCCVLLWENISNGFDYIAVSLCGIFFLIYYKKLYIFLQRSVGFRAAPLDIVTKDTLFHHQNNWKNTYRCIV